MERPPLFIWPVHASCSTKKVKQCAAIPHPESATRGGSPGARVWAVQWNLWRHIKNKKK